MTATFSERNWKTRIGGDFFYHSESKFEEHWPGPFAHFGLGASTEGMATYKMSPFLSHTPDYIAALTDASTPVLVEVQGTGRGGATDGVLNHKFKARKLDTLAKWNSSDEVTFWLWNDADQSHIWTSYGSIRMMLGRGVAQYTDTLFDGKRPGWIIPVEEVARYADTDRLIDRYG